VNPGDYIVGDGDGLVAFSTKDAPRLLNAARAKLAAEEQIRTSSSKDKGRAFLEGELAKKGWL